MVPTEKFSKSSAKFHCEICDYHTCRSSQYDRHLLTRKHKILQNPLEKSSANYVCDCGRFYQHSSTLYAHKKKCKKEKVTAPLVTDASNNAITNESLLDFLKNDFKNILIEVFKNGMNNNTNCHNTNTNTNSHNKTKFNMNFFLNEQCKDAMNIMDFVNTLQLNLRDLERVGEEGYVKGISHIIVNNLKDLDVHKRPVHCSDVKRETMYVKDEDAWAKDEAKKKLSKMITHVAHKNQKQIGEWKDENPEHTDSESTKSEQFLKIVGESMNGLTNDEESDGYTNKIIKTIAKEVVIKEEE